MHDGKIDVLVVEDNPGDANLLDLFLTTGNAPFTVKHSQRLSNAVEQLSEERADAMLLDLGLPDSQGLDTLRQARKLAPQIPIVIMTGLNDEELAVEALREGAQDYLVKGKITATAVMQSLRYAIERQRLREQAEQLQLQQIALKDEFLSHVSHELRSPLNAIYQFVSILSDGLAGECNQQQREYLEIISRNIGQLQSMINELLDITRAGAGKLSVDLQATDVAQTIEDAMNTVKPAAASKSVALSMEVPPNLPPAYADPGRLQQVLVNLLENGIKFTPPSGKVNLKVWLVPGVPEMLQFSVSDTGCGISPEFCQRIFERLYQVKSTDGSRQGLGLGLYICRELVTKQGGRIWVDSSSSEQGSTFCFTLPVLSLPDILSPILSTEQSQPNSLVVIGVEVWLSSGWSSDALREMAMRQTRYLVDRCVLPDLDIVLPKLPVGGESEFVFVVARTDVKGADVIRKRIAGQLQRSEELRRGGIRWGIDFRMLALPETERLAEHMANIVRKEIEEWTRFRPKDKR